MTLSWLDLVVVAMVAFIVSAIVSLVFEYQHYRDQHPMSGVEK